MGGGGGGFEHYDSRDSPRFLFSGLPGFPPSTHKNPLF